MPFVSLALPGKDPCPPPLDTNMKRFCYFSLSISAIEKFPLVFIIKNNLPLPLDLHQDDARNIQV
jgi:hypothetical protein